MEQNRVPRKKKHAHIITLFMKEPGVQNRARTVSSMNGVWKTQYSHANE